MALMAAHPAQAQHLAPASPLAPPYAQAQLNGTLSGLTLSPNGAVFGPLAHSTPALKRSQRPHGQIRRGQTHLVTISPQAQGAAFTSTTQQGLGGAWSVGKGLNDHDVAVGQSSSADGAIHDVLFNHGKVIDLGVVQQGENDCYLNNRNHVASIRSFDGNPYAAHAALWANGQWQDLGVQPGDLSSAALGINNLDQVVGYSTNSNYSEYGAVWNPGTGIVALQTLPGDMVAFPEAINDLGVICGYSVDSNYNDTPVVWQSATAIPTPIPTPGIPITINRAGQVAGSWYDSTVGYNKLFVWDATHGVQDLGTPPGSLPPPYFYSFYGSFTMHLNDNGLLTANVQSGGSYASGPEIDGWEPLFWSPVTGLHVLSDAGINFSAVGGANNSDHLVGQIGAGLPGQGLAGLAAREAITPLGALPSGWSYAYGLNNLGETVGGALAPGNTIAAPYLDYVNWSSAVAWGVGSRPTPLTALPTGAANALAINDSGQTVGLVANQISLSAPAYGYGPLPFTALFLYQIAHAALWDNTTGQLTDLGTPNGFPFAAATAINNSGWVAGVGEDTVNLPRNQSAFVYDPTTATMTTPLAGQDGGYSNASGINNLGQITGVIGYWWYYGALGGGYFYDMPSATLTMFPDPYYNGTYPSGINDAGQVVGTIYDDYYDARAFLWTAQGGLVDLGDLEGAGPDNSVNASASSVNRFGQILGTSDTPGGTHTFLIEQDGSMMDLTPALTAAGLSDFVALRLNDRGQLAGWRQGNQIQAALVSPRARLKALGLGTGIVKGGKNLKGTVQLSTACPYDLYVQLSSSDPSVSVPAWARVPGGSASVTFPITTSAVSQPTFVTVTASFAGVNRSAQVTVKP
jgi:probable HAF family extracellular repeat protein